MRHSTMKYIEDELKGYVELKKHIAEVRLEVEHPWNETDTNIGGGQGNLPSSPTEIKATRLVNDKRLKHLTEVEKAIEDMYTELDDRGKEFVNLMYFKKPRQYTIEGVAQRIHVSKRTAYNIRKEIIKRVAENLGMANIR